MIEEVDDVAEWLADQARVYGSCPDSEKDSCYQEKYCRTCWTIAVKQRIRDAVLAESKHGHAPTPVSRHRQPDIFVRIKRHGPDGPARPVYLDEMTDAELDSLDGLMAQQATWMTWTWVKTLARWIREHRQEEDRL